MLHHLARWLLPLLGAASLGAQTYRISTDPWIAWTPLWVAQQKGFWKQHGIDVQVVNYTGGDSVAVFKAGKVDFGMVMAGTAVGLQVEDGLDVTVLAEVDWSHGGDKILVKKGTQLAALKGQRIGIYEDSPAVRMFLGAKLNAAGMRASDFEIVVLEDLESMTSQFLAGRLACSVTYEPYASQATAKGVCEVIATTADFPGVMPEVIVAHRQALAKMPPAHVAAVLRGWIEAVEWSQDPKNQAEFTAICVTKAFGDEKVEPAQIATMLQNVRIHGRAALRARNLGKDGIRKFLDECAAFATHKAGKRARPGVGDMLDTRALEQALGPAVAAPVK